MSAPRFCGDRCKHRCNSRLSLARPRQGEWRDPSKVLQGRRESGPGAAFYCCTRRAVRIQSKRGLRNLALLLTALSPWEGYVFQAQVSSPVGYCGDRMEGDLLWKQHSVAASICCHDLPVGLPGCSGGLGPTDPSSVGGPEHHKSFSSLARVPLSASEFSIVTTRNFLSAHGRVEFSPGENPFSLSQGCRLTWLWAFAYNSLASRLLHLSSLTWGSPIPKRLLRSS